MKKLKVLLADDQDIARLGVRALLEGAEDSYQIVAETDDAEQTLRAAVRLKPDLIILDTTMPKSYGARLVKDLKAYLPDVHIVILTMNDDAEHFSDVLDAGANGYIIKVVTTKDILTGIETVLRGERYFGPYISKRVVENYLKRNGQQLSKQLRSKHKLTKREVEILHYIAKGLTNKQIAKNLFISFRTVHNHRNNLMKKLDVHNTADLVRWAMANGIIQAEKKQQ